MNARHALFRFDGRLRRRDWWLWSIALFVAQTLLTRAADTLMFDDDADLRAGNFFAWFFGSPPVPGVYWTGLALAMVFLWPALALIRKRAQDRDRHGWDLVAIHGVFMLGYIIPEDAYETAGRAVDAGEWVAAAPMLLGTVIVLTASLYLLVVLAFLDGTPGPNRFGRSPKGIGGDPAEAAAEVFS